MKSQLYLLLLCSLVFAPALAQTTRYVSTKGTSPASGASSWGNSTTDLQGAIDYVATQGGGEVWVTAGRYQPTAGQSFAMANGVAIYGGFAGGETVVSGRPAINPVSGQPSSSTLLGNGSRVITNPSGLTTTAVLDGFVITGGRSDQGGGMYNSGSSPRLANCLFVGNSATASGGSNSINLAYGGAIYNTGSSPQLTNCVLQSNQATASGGSNSINLAYGGAIYNTGSSPQLTNCVLQSNSATASGVSTNRAYGGAIYNETNSPQLTNCVLQSNSATASGGNNNQVYGGAICNLYSSSPQLTNCVLWNNGGSNTFFNNNNSSVTATYTLFDQSVTDYSSSPTNLTTTTSPFSSTSSVALAACSPAINTGNPASQTAATAPYSETALPITDRAGNNRIVGGRVDMGAVEYQGPQYPTRLYVSASQTVVTGDGLSWATAFPDLQQALTYPCSQSLTEIWVASGVYKPTSTTARNVSFTMLPGVKIYGGFAGTENSLSQRPNVNPVSGNPSSSTLSGDIGTVGNSSDNSNHIISNNGLNSSAILDGFILIGGNDNSSGGAIYNSNSSPMLTNCSFTGNQAFNGGALHNTGTSFPTLTNCNFTSNTATNGGALFGSVVLIDCRFISNIASQKGGAIYAGSSLSVTNCSFHGNQAIGNGGGIYNNGSSIPITSCSFTSNTASNGGAFFGSAELTNSSFINNTVSQFGGAIYAGSSLSVVNCSFQGNLSPLNGGGIFIAGGIIPITSCIFTSNTATNGGAFFGSAELTNSSFINNTVSQSGGAIYGGSSLSISNCSFQGNLVPNGYGGAIFGNATLTNSVFWGNGGSKTLEGSTFAPTYSLLDNTSNVNLSGPGNLTTSISPFVNATSVALIVCSPAINTGNPTSQTVATGPYSAIALPALDLEGNARIFGDRVDMGAVEFQGTPNYPLACTLSPASGSAVCVGGSVSVPVGLTGQVH